MSQELQAETLYASMKEKTLTSQVPANAGGEEFTQVLVGVQNKLAELCSKTHTEETPLKLTGLEQESKFLYMERNVHSYNGSSTHKG